MTDGQSRLTPGAPVRLRGATDDGGDGAGGGRVAAAVGAAARWRRRRSAAAAAGGSGSSGEHMSLTGLFIRRPVMTTLIMIGIVVFGIVSYRKLPVSDLPTVDYPTINVNANLPGASPETMAATVATPLEKAFSAIAGIDEITSNSSLGSTNITLQFSLDRDIESAAQDVNAAIGKTLPFLPPTILPPNYRKQNPSAAPILSIALTSNVAAAHASSTSTRETTIAQRLSMVEGVAQVERVRLDEIRRARAARSAQLASAQHRRVAGRERDPQQQRDAADGRAVRQGPDAHGAGDGPAVQRREFRRLIIAYKNGAPVRLGDVANVLDDIQNNKNASAGTTTSARST